MTREEVIKGFEENALYPLTGKQLIKVFNDIYGYFESRICKNCKYIRIDYAPTCDLGISSGKLFDNDIVNLDFGCNRFEPKENE